MYRLTQWWMAFVVCLILGAPLGVLAQDAGQAEVLSPRPNAVVRDTVIIQGSATHPDFWKYEVWMAPGLSPSDGQWFVIDLQERQVPSGGQLTAWNSRAVPDGVYSLRLRVVRRDGNYAEVVVQPINVANAEPPTPEPSPTLEATPTTEVEATPELTITTVLTTTRVPTLVTGTPPPSGTLVPDATRTPAPTFTPFSGTPTVFALTEAQPTAPSSAAVASSRSRDDNDLFAFDPSSVGLDLTSLSSACFGGMALTLGIFLVVGLLGMGRQILRWFF